MIAKKLNIKGHVQGVFFRASSKEKADQLGLTGTVRNCRQSSRSVKVYVEGDDVAVEEFIEWCHQGPDAAEVEEVEVQDIKPEGAKSFEILG